MDTELPGNVICPVDISVQALTSVTRVPKIPYWILEYTRFQPPFFPEFADQP